MSAHGRVSSGESPERRTTPLELLWDLVFVFAVTRVTTLLTTDLSWEGFGRAMLALALVWWAWSAFVWATNAQNPDAVVVRCVLLMATVLIFVTGLALPHAYKQDATWFAGTYAGVRLLHLVLYVDAARRGRASARAISGFAITVAVGMALLMTGSLASGWARGALWTAAAAIDYAGPAWLTRKRLRELQRVAVAHFAERYGLFIIICLGESIVAIGIGASADSLTAVSLAAVCLMLSITIGLWWIYFYRSAAIAEEHLRTHHDPVLAAADGYSYIHLSLVAGIITFAVGARHAVAHANAPLSTTTRLALCGGVALYLAGHAAFRLRLTGFPDYAQLAAGAALILVFAATAGIAAWATAGILMLVLALLATWQTIAERMTDKPACETAETQDAHPGPDAATITSLEP